MIPWRMERGAAAVEFALVVPVLLLLLLGIIEFGRAYNTQISLTHAARETARHMVIHDDGTASATAWTAASAAGRNAAPALKGSDMAFTGTSTKCTAGSMLTVTITYPLKTVTGVAKDMTLSGKAAMRCGG
ncbi:TadE/TadG family type IV pilus assembly protein [Kocuria sabuli]|uniref:TadE/TadG family type IV pilus assembly protein n=1 Tax=Kocuria sabuli TaxID=3071448 RepID=UPI0034D4AECE